MGRGLNKIKNFRTVYKKCCANCRYYIPDNEQDAYCRRDKEHTFDSAASQEWISVCDGFYYDWGFMISKRTINSLM